MSGSDVTNGTYTLNEGDYLQVDSRGHSALFYRYIDSQGGSGITPPDSPTGNTWIRCIEGNLGPERPKPVVINDRQLSTIDNVGKIHG